MRVIFFPLNARKKNQKTQWLLKQRQIILKPALHTRAGLPGLNVTGGVTLIEEGRGGWRG